MDSLPLRLATLTPPCDVCSLREACREGELTCSAFRIWVRDPTLIVSEIGEDILGWSESFPEANKPTETDTFGVPVLTEVID